ncbi:hypothetical protein AVEN_56717-1 [Araneus ventricosus]|uniref:Uncharacterized protein n=1 Tax=Araneus ventricosus TaxID=182803 RepID=A0A4Y2WGP0_ARAVE|nr:hypothetical protein AVEN_56717-1 [Araneus ventricosus]
MREVIPSKESSSSSDHNSKLRGSFQNCPLVASNREVRNKRRSESVQAQSQSVHTAKNCDPGNQPKCARCGEFSQENHACRSTRYSNGVYVDEKFKLILVPDIAP